jgi:hypothetical protein
MKYITPGFSMSLRSMTKRPKNVVKALYNLLFMRYYDILMRKIKGQNWIDKKNKKAIVNANKNLRKTI